jgi:hypothetical protein
MNRRSWLASAAGAAALAIVGDADRLVASIAAPKPRIVVHKDPGCGCCAKWVTYLKTQGFEVTVRDTADVAAVKKRYGVPTAAASCHTGLVGGYVVEGHVPADLIQRMLKEKPKAVGIAVPGMPTGSPGMEGSPKMPYDVLLIEQSGATRVYARR